MMVVVHIGSPKTGSTALQRTLASARRQLRRYGWHYPIGFDAYGSNHNALSAMLAGDRRRRLERWLRRERNRAERNRCHGIVISAETLYGAGVRNPNIVYERDQELRSKQERILRNLAELLTDCDVRVVAYLRPQRELSEALYHLSVKRVDGTSDSFHEYLPKIECLLDYNRIIERWENHFGQRKVQVRDYTQALPDIADDFRNTILCVPRIQEEGTSGIMGNKRPSREYITLKRSVNRIRMRRAWAINYKRALGEVFSVMNGLDYSPLLTRSEAEEMTREYAESNEELWTRVGIDGGFRQFAPDQWPYSDHEGGVTIERMYEIEIRLALKFREPRMLVGLWFRLICPESLRSVAGAAVRGIRGRVRGRRAMQPL